MLNHGIVYTGFHLLFFRTSPGLKRYFTFLKFSYKFQDPSKEHLRMIEAVLLFDLLKLVIKFEALVLLVDYLDSLFFLFIVDCVYTLHLYKGK